MKLSSTIFLVLLSTLAHAFTTSPSVKYDYAPSSLYSFRLQAVKVFYDSSTGNTETCAGYIASAIGDASADYIGDATEDEIKNADALIVGAPTWHTGADTERSGTSWDTWLYDTLPNLGLEGKKVAIFGCGDQESYSDYYCDAAGELYDNFVKAGCKVYGMTSTEGYGHQASKAEIESGKFCGLMFDEDNQYDLSEERAQKWIAQLKEEGCL